MTSGPVPFVRLSPADYRRTPWKNGGGVTVDIADSYAPGAAPGGWDGMIWRFGRTRIERPAPFSDLSGHDRILAVIGGSGLVLRTPGLPDLDAREPYRPIRFPGERVIDSVLENGPVAVLNLMGARPQVHLDLAFLAHGAAASVGPGQVLVYATAGPAVVRLGVETHSLSADECLQGSPDVAIEVASESGWLALACIRERAPTGPG